MGELLLFVLLKGASRLASLSDSAVELLWNLYLICRTDKGAKSPCLPIPEHQWSVQQHSSELLTGMLYQL